MMHGGDIYRFDRAVLDCSANLNPLGMPKSVQQAAMDAVLYSESYPDPECRALKKALAECFPVLPEQIVCGNGAADLIDRFALAFRPERALVLAPTFSEYERALAAVGCRVNHFCLSPQQAFLPDETLEEVVAGYDLVFLCNPNNPTGTALSRERMRRITEACQTANTRLIVDECFMDFLEREEDYSLLQDLKDFPNLILLKAFTKLYAMAGLRLGYAFCGSVSDATAAAGALQPWSVSTVASAAGIAALEETAFVEKSKEYVAGQRAYLQQGLISLGLTVYPSKTNYLLFQTSRELLRPLEEQGILLRSCANYHTLDQSYYRTAVRTEEENTRLLHALKLILED